ncbi:LysR substrate-binding domain-containing protein [Pseudoalteromonas sp. ASV78]|uniref:LysR family transcriptional regulator n=1 Tax=Pseudoalteromonas sp. ASV78 TaxID=3397851 RepID=UPI0039FC91C2
MNYLFSGAKQLTVDLSLIPIFVTVVDTGSFTVTASQFGLSKGAVSQKVSLLEKQLGSKLLNRTTRKHSLTQAGAAYYDYAKQMVNLTKLGQDALNELSSEPKGLLTVSAPMEFGRLHVMPLINDFLSLYPKISIELSLDDKFTDLVQGQVDLSIRIGELEDSTLIAKKVADCHSVVCASPDYFITHGKPLAVADLANHSCLYYTYFQGGTQWRLQKQGCWYYVKPEGVFKANNSHALLQAAIAGLGIVQLPLFLAEQEITNKNLLPILTDYSLPKHSVYLVTHDRKYRPKKLTLLIDYISSIFSQKNW